VQAISVHIQPSQEIWLRPDLLFAGGFDLTRTPTYFRIVVDPGGPQEISSGNIGWSETFVIPNGCDFAAPSPGAPWQVELWSGNSIGEDYCNTQIIAQDLSGVCP
jgi:hypothetical protein